MMLHAVITTIQRPTPSVMRLARCLADHGGALVIAGDTKGPQDFDLSEISGFSRQQLSFLSIEDQAVAGFSIAEHLPTKHYCRKNIGYLHAIRSGASCIYETDDDNAPLDHWAPRSQWVGDLRYTRSNAQIRPEWINVYKHFSDGLIWPRGLPLDRIGEPSVISDSAGDALTCIQDDQGRRWAPIQQGLADGAPDVDAAWRLILDQEFFFDRKRSIMLSPGQWCPFNTQTTWWWPVVYPLLYVPSYCSFRMCDIWKSFVAQRCLWELGTGLVFHAAEVFQERNPHNLMRDFEDEVPGYLQNNRLVEILESLSLRSGTDAVAANLRICYEALVDRNIFPDRELSLLDAWIADVAAASEQAVQGCSGV